MVQSLTKQCFCLSLGFDAFEGLALMFITSQANKKHEIYTIEEEKKYNIFQNSTKNET